ncbi:hypothetical protein B0J14DRAFT_569765 [Halenospora varia]|nr:hypothetical protein B0J14DRAFT_569765 [Halenospora varia]
MVNKKSGKCSKPKPVTAKQASKANPNSASDAKASKANCKSAMAPSPTLSGPELVTIGVTSKMVVKKSLAFRSAKLGNLNAAPVAHMPVVPLPATNTVTYLTTNSATPTVQPAVPQKSPQASSVAGTAQAKPPASGPPETYLIRADKSQKDFIISAGGAKRNAKRFARETGRDGKLRSKLLINYFEGDYDLVQSIGKMSELRKKEMWAGRYIDINVNLATAGSAKTTVNDTIDKLGPEFVECVESVFVNLVFLEDDQSPVPKHATFNKPFAPELPKNSPIVDLSSNATVIMLTRLIHRLNSLKSLKRLDVTFRVSTNNGPACVTLDQLHHLLPFYFLDFTKWGAWWFNATMKSPAKIIGKSVRYLDAEATKIIQAEESSPENDGEASKDRAK